MEVDDSGGALAGEVFAVDLSGGCFVFFAVGEEDDIAGADADESVADAGFEDGGGIEFFRHIGGGSGNDSLWIFGIEVDDDAFLRGFLFFDDVGVVGDDDAEFFELVGGGEEDEVFAADAEGEV